MNPFCPLFLAIGLLLPGCSQPSPAPSPPPNPPTGWSMLLSGPTDGPIYIVRGGVKTTLPITGSAPSWTPDGHMVYADAGQLYLANGDGTGSHAVGPAGLGATAPTAARDGTIAFMGAHGGVYLLRSGGLTVLLPPATGQPGAPSYMQPYIAPSGMWLAYVTQTENPYHREVWRMNADGSGQRALTTPGDDPLRPDANAPAISPDESQVAIFSGQDAAELPSGGPTIFGVGHRDVALVPAVGGGPRRLLTNCTPVDDQAQLNALPAGVCVLADNPAWAPDGKSLVFDMLLRGGSVTGTVNVDGTGLATYYPQTRGVERVPLR